MASVLLCEDERLGRQVAVKRLHADSPTDVEQRFTREAKLGASLNHPNLVSVFDTATDDEGVLIVMEYVDGEPLSRVLRRGPLRPEEVRRMVLDLGDALDHAHAQGVVHRDVKPGNVLIREDGMTKLADLGIATASDGTRITRSGTVLGTAAYMAPEQLDGRETGPPADIYALAAIAFEALSGKKPREGRNPMEIAHSIATEGPPDLRDAWPKAPKAAAHVLQRGMALEPGDRPASAGELARELADALGEEPEETKKTRLLAGAAGAASAPRDRRSRPPSHTPASTAAPPPSPPARRSRASGGRRPERHRHRARAHLHRARRRHDRRRRSVRRRRRWRLLAERRPRRRPSHAEAEQGRRAEEAEGEEGAEVRRAGGRSRRSPRRTRTAPYDPARGAELNDEGFILMNQGRYDEAVTVLQQAVDSFPPGTSDLNYAYALFNLGKSLRLAGRPDEAIPVLEQRLEIPNQTETVKHELDAGEAGSRRRASGELAPDAGGQVDPRRVAELGRGLPGAARGDERLRR